MRYCALTAVAVAAGLVSASPIEKRQAIDDCTILNYALTIGASRRQVLSGGPRELLPGRLHCRWLPRSFLREPQGGLFDETTHVSFLTTTSTGAGCPYVVNELTYAFGVADPRASSLLPLFSRKSVSQHTPALLHLS